MKKCTHKWGHKKHSWKKKERKKRKEKKEKSNASNESITELKEMTIQSKKWQLYKLNAKLDKSLKVLWRKQKTRNTCKN